MSEKEKTYRMQAVTTNFMGHRYIGFEGKTCSRMATDDKQRAIEECAWVWDSDKKCWLKQPKEAQ